MIQVRSGALRVAALVAREVEAVWPAQSTILSTLFGGVKLGCIASPINRVPRLLVVRKDITGVNDLRGKVIGVQSIGGGFWLQTMIILDALGVDPERHGVKFSRDRRRPVIAQALMSGNIDAAALTYSLSEPALKSGISLPGRCRGADRALPGPSMCALKEVLAGRQEFFQRLTRGLAEATAFILQSLNKAEVIKSLMKHLRLAKSEKASCPIKCFV
jgi:ABC-type nitrate/sulfonate/bicarbonate transport system substrate-binding protein